ncbi:unnamed protein product, partial [Amoebophrya sp. A25]
AKVVGFSRSSSDSSSTTSTSTSRRRTSSSRGEPNFLRKVLNLHHFFLPEDQHLFHMEKEDDVESSNVNSTSGVMSLIA